MQKKRILLLCVLIIGLLTPVLTKADKISTENDFFLNVLYNPKFSLRDFKKLGLNSRNTTLNDYSAYINNTKVQKKCKELGLSVYDAYNNVKKAWKIYLEVQNVGNEYLISYHQNNIFAPKLDSNIVKKLNIIPLLYKY